MTRSGRIIVKGKGSDIHLHLRRIIAAEEARRVPVAGLIPWQDVDANAPHYKPTVSREAVKS